MEEFVTYRVREKKLQVIDGNTLSQWTRYGISIHRGVIVVWDEDRDTRVLTWLELQPCEVVDALVAVEESEGCLTLLWRDHVYQGYEVGKVLDADLDCWAVIESRKI